MSRTTAARAAVVLLTVLSGALVVIAVVTALWLGWRWPEAVGSFLVTNAALASSFTVCGAIMAWHRPANPIGWLFGVGGLAYAITSGAAPIGEVLVARGASTEALRVLATLFAWSWPWAIGLCLPLALVLFPTGRPPSRRWRPVVVAIIVTAPLFALEMGADPSSAGPDGPVGYLTLTDYAELSPLWIAVEVRGLLAMAAGLVALVVRYRRGRESERRQLLWLVLAVVIMIGAVIPWGVVAGTSELVLLAIPLVPIAITIAVVRHQLLDIRLVFSRVLAWVLLSLAVVVAYVAIVAVLDRLINAQVGRSALATVLLALLAAPVLPRLQRLADRAIYGHRDNPARLVSQVGAQLVARDSGLDGVVGAIANTLRMPYAAVVRDELILSRTGSAPERLHSTELSLGGDRIADLVLGLRPGERRLSAADARAIALLAPPLAAAVNSMIISAEVQSSREKIVAAREEERRRLRRDLHDGLGPTLTGIAFSADAAANLLATDPERAAQLITTLRRDTRDALTDVRRLVDSLRPPALDELGLIGALRQRADQLAWRADGTPVEVRVDVPDQVPHLPAAVEVATFRIATEALTNVVRHSLATAATVQLRVDDQVEVSVIDNGSTVGSWTPGVGISAMRERVAELGGVLQAGPTADGGRVAARLPLVTS